MLLARARSGIWNSGAFTLTSAQRPNCSAERQGHGRNPIPHVRKTHCSLVTERGIESEFRVRWLIVTARFGVRMAAPDTACNRVEELTGSPVYSHSTRRGAKFSRLRGIQIRTNTCVDSSEFSRTWLQFRERLVESCSGTFAVRRPQCIFRRC
jgi:hypothetical protein